MSITGGVKFFEGAKNLYKDDTEIVASTGDDAAKYVLDYNKYTLWESIGSNDITQETLEITFDGDKTIDRLFIAGHNLKQYQAQYWDGLAYVDFTNAIGINSEVKGAVSETAYDRTTSYYEFDAVTTDQIILYMDKTQTVDVDKEVTALLVTEEIGTFEGYPRVSKIKHNRNIRAARTLSGKAIIQKSYETASFKIAMSIYPLQSDIDILNTLHDREDSFLVWLCGGRAGTQYFRFANRGWKPDDIFHMQVDKPLNTDYANGIYVNGVDQDISLVEVV